MARVARVSTVVAPATLMMFGIAGCVERAPAPSHDEAEASRASVANDVRIVDGDTLVLAGQRHRVFGIDAPEATAVCNGADGRFWPCGRAATARLAALSAAAPLDCRREPGQQDRYGRLISRCRAGGQDVAEVLVREGLAWAFVRYSQDYVAAERAARRRGAGVWQADNEPAWEWRARRREGKAVAGAGEPAPAPPPGCDIKGNVSANGRIYHLPGSRDYAATRISTARGERWFCSEREARAAGWRAPR